MRKEDIIFIISPSLWSSNMYPTGVLCLSAYLQKRGFENIILDSAVCRRKMPKKAKEEAILSKIKEFKPKIVCFSATHKEFDEIVRMNNAIKSIADNIFTIVGGPQPTYRPADFLDNGFDFAGVGEGEATLYEFVQEVFAQSYQWNNILGLCWKNGQKNVLNPPRPLMTQEELNDIPILPYNKINRKYFDIDIRMIRGLPLKGALIMTTRGCPFSCSYCGCNLIFGKKLRSYSLEHIETEIKHLREEYDVEGIWIADDTFTMKTEHAMGVSGILKKYGIIWGCQSRVDTVNEELVKIMKDSGCVQIDFGVESGSRRILSDIIGKRINAEQVENAFKVSKKYKIRTLANFMIGLPTESYEDLRKTQGLADKIKADVYIFSIATPLPGTRLYDMVNEEITPQEYSLLDWNGSIFMEKINKSELSNLQKERLRLEKKYFLSTVIKSSFSKYNLFFFLKRRYKYQRIRCILRYLKEYLTKKVFSVNTQDKIGSTN